MTALWHEVAIGTAIPLDDIYLWLVNNVGYEDNRWALRRASPVQDDPWLGVYRESQRVTAIAFSSEADAVWFSMVWG